MLDPRTFYEPVEPSEWKPPEGDTCLELYKRAYCGTGDLLMPPIYFSVLGIVCFWGLLPVWAILLLLLPLFGLGMHCLVFRGESTAMLTPCTSSHRDTLVLEKGGLVQLYTRAKIRW